MQTTDMVMHVDDFTGVQKDFAGALNLQGGFRIVINNGIVLIDYINKLSTDKKIQSGRHLLQLAVPVVQLPLEYLARQPLPLPDGIIGVLHREVRKRAGPPRAAPGTRGLSADAR